MGIQAQASTCPVFNGNFFCDVYSKGVFVNQLVLKVTTKKTLFSFNQFEYRFKGRDNEKLDFGMKASPLPGTYKDGKDTYTSACKDDKINVAYENGADGSAVYAAKLKGGFSMKQYSATAPTTAEIALDCNLMKE